MGTRTLFSSLNALNGKEIGSCMQRHRHQEFIRSLNSLSRVARHPRWTLHFTPTSTSWLNAVEGFFAKLTKRRSKRGVFRSIGELQTTINRFLGETNADPQPFRWVEDPDKIIATVKSAKVGTKCYIHSPVIAEPRWQIRPYLCRGPIDRNNAGLLWTALIRTAVLIRIIDSPRPIEGIRGNEANSNINTRKRSTWSGCAKCTCQI